MTEYLRIDSKFSNIAAKILNRLRTGTRRDNV